MAWSNGGNHIGISTQMKPVPAPKPEQIQRQKLEQVNSVEPTPNYQAILSRATVSATRLSVKLAAKNPRRGRAKYKTKTTSTA